MRLGDLRLNNNRTPKLVRAGNPGRACAPGAADDLVITGLAYDSRDVRPGALFAAWRGAVADGHAFASAAVAKGAVLILCEEVPEGLAAETWCWVTSCVRKTLAFLARAFYGAPDAHLVTVGITGTNGKTTCALLAAEVLSAAYGSAASLGTLGLKTLPALAPATAVPLLRPLTTPESVDLSCLLAFLRKEHVAAVALEASSQALDQHRLDGTFFDVALVTNITRDHLDYHGTLEAYRHAKARLGLERLKPHGRLVINLDDPEAARLASRTAVTVTARDGQKADVQIVLREKTANHMHLVARTPRGPLPLSTPWSGQHNLENIAVVVGMAEVLGLPHEAIARAVARGPSVPGRLERVSVPSARLAHPVVLIDYAHTPDALLRALGAARAMTSGQVSLVFGCGGDRDRGKRARMGRVAAEQADRIYITNDNPRSEAPQQIADAIMAGVVAQGGKADVLLQRDVAIALAIQEAGHNDVVLIAGKGHETYQIVGAERFDFDDRAVAAACLARLTPSSQKERVG